MRRYLRRFSLFRKAETQWRYTQARGGVGKWIFLGLGSLVLLTLIWIVVTGLVARSDALTIRSRLAEVQSLVARGDVTGAQKVAATIPGLAHRAHRLTTGPAWYLASEVPWAGKPAQIVRGTAAATDELGSTGVTALLSVIGQLDPSKLRTNGDTVNLAPIEQAAPKLKVVDLAVNGALAKLRSVPTSSWLSPIDSVRTDMVTTLNAVGGYIDAANRAAQVLPSLLGGNTPKRYFVGLQNEAEMRGTGGLPGAFAILVASKGTIKFTHFESDATLMPGSTHLVDTGLDFGPEYDQLYASSQPTERYVDSNVSPNFPYTAQIWAAMWEKVSGEHVDGAIALDPQVLANLLQATGPIQAAGGYMLTSANVVPLTEAQEYAIFTSEVERKDFLVAVLKDVSSYAISGRTSAVDLVHALSLSSQEHRVLFWSDDAADQAVIDGTNYTGRIPQSTTRSFAGVVITNAAAGKLDYYLRRSLTYSSTGCGATSDVEVQISLTNTAPASGLPAYVTTRLDHDPPPGVKPGDNRDIVDYWATPGAELASVSIDGKFATVATYEQLGHPLYRLDVELPVGATRTIDFHLVEPRKAGAPDVWQQPGVVPMTTNVESQHC